MNVHHQSITPNYNPSPNPLAPAYQAWKISPWNLFPKGDRAFPKNGLSLHESVYARLQGGPVVPHTGETPEIYNPVNIKHFHP